jgi:RNA polymerase sigma factor (sigma-70 family)
MSRIPESLGQRWLSLFPSVWFAVGKPMLPDDDDFLPTRQSLLSRLRSWRNEESWQEFFDTYGRLIYRMAMKTGLSDAEAQDVVQETMILVARKMPDFKYDPAIGSFKSWLRLLTRRRIEKQLKKRLPGMRAPSAWGGRAALAADETRRTSTIDRISDPKGFDLEAQWDLEWEINLEQAALARVKRQVKPKQYQMFDLYAIKHWPVRDVARSLGVTVAHVYVIKHRIGAMLKRELSRLQLR